MSTYTTIKTQINKLISNAKAITGNAGTDLTTQVNALISGYGSDSGSSGATTKSGTFINEALDDSTDQKNFEIDTGLSEIYSFVIYASESLSSAGLDYFTLAAKGDGTFYYSLRYYTQANSRSVSSAELTDSYATVSGGTITQQGTTTSRMPVNGMQYNWCAVGAQSYTTFEQENEYVSAYLSASSDYEEGGTDSVIGTYADGTKRCNPTGYGSGYTGTLTVTGSKNYSYDISNSPIYNVVPQTTSTVKVVGDSALDSTSIMPLGYVRMLYMENIVNVRDLGGWECDGGRVAYNKLIRGTQLVDSSGAQSISSLDAEVLLNAVGILAELNWQETTEDGAITASILGSGVAFQRCPLNNDNGYTTQISGDNLSTFIEGIQWGMEQVIAGHPVYMHCAAGRDRTGIAAFVFNAVLGVSENDLDRDYELTRFDGTSGTTITRGTTNWVNFKNALKDYTGDTLRDKVIYWLRTNGVPMDTILSFRAAMSTGTPETLEDPYTEKVNQLLNAVDADGNAWTDTYSNGLKPDYRLNSSGVEVSATNYSISGYIPIGAGQTVTFAGTLSIADGVNNIDTSVYVPAYDSDFTLVHNGRCDYLTKGTGWTLAATLVDGDSSHIASITNNSSTAAYFRVCTYTTSWGDSPAIYVE